MKINNFKEIPYHDLFAVTQRRRRIFHGRSYSCPAWIQSIPRPLRAYAGIESVLKRIKENNKENL
jgi:hypothetical protein